MTLPTRQQALADRAVMVERLRAALPQAMRERRQWLVWRFGRAEDDAPDAKPRKLPYYASNGRRRGGTREDPVAQGSERDLSGLVSFEAALDRLGGALQYDGLGFAFLPGDGLVGVDVDGAIDPETGEISERCREVIERCASYTELSPSGRGVHVVCAGETKTFKHNSIGLEVFCGSQFFCCTGEWWSAAPREVQPLAPEALEWLRAQVEAAKAVARGAAGGVPLVAPAGGGGGAAGDAGAERGAAAAGDPVPAAPVLPARRALGPDDTCARGGGDYRRVNDAAMQLLPAWVPALFPAAVARGQGFRVSSKALGRELEEDLAITPEGIVDWGVHDMGDPHEGRRTPIDLVMEHRGGTPRDALRWLAERTGVQLTARRRLQLVRPEPEPPPDDGDIPPPPHPDEAQAGAPRTRGKGGGGGGARGRNGSGDGLERLRQHVALVYGTDTVWDGLQQRVMKVGALRLLYGNDDVRAWLRSDERRRVVLPEDIVFDPAAAEVPPHQVNLWTGFATVPDEEHCSADDVEPMLELLWHLCSQSSGPAEGASAGTASVSEVVHQVLCWLALPLQQPGAKLAFALVFHGPQGTGKNMFFDAVRRMYGRYGRMVGQNELEDKFNDWLSAKLLIIGNEVVTRQELYHHKNKLKWLITEDEIPIRGMMQSVRWEANHANLVFLSNEHQPLALEKDDRRYLVVYTPGAREDEMYLRARRFLDEGGAARFHAYLLRYELRGFHTHTKPLMTSAKESLIELGLKPAERFANEWLRGLLPLPVQVCSAEQLYRVFRRWCDMTGERFPPPQAQFTETVKKHVHEAAELDAGTGQRLDAALRYKVVNLKPDLGARRCLRCWLPRGTAPLNGVTEGEWAAASVDAFEAAAQRFGRPAHVDEGGGDASVTGTA